MRCFPAGGGLPYQPPRGANRAHRRPSSPPVAPARQPRDAVRPGVRPGLRDRRRDPDRLLHAGGDLRRRRVPGHDHRQHRQCLRSQRRGGRPRVTPVTPRARSPSTSATSGTPTGRLTPSTRTETSSRCPAASECRVSALRTCARVTRGTYHVGGHTWYTGPAANRGTTGAVRPYYLCVSTAGGSLQFSACRAPIGHGPHVPRLMSRRSSRAFTAANRGESTPCPRARCRPPPNLASQYSVQVTDDLESNIKEQERVSAGDHRSAAAAGRAAARPRPAGEHAAGARHHLPRRPSPRPTRPPSPLPGTAPPRSRPPESARGAGRPPPLPSAPPPLKPGAKPASKTDAAPATAGGQVDRQADRQVVHQGRQEAGGEEGVDAGRRPAHAGRAGAQPPRRTE